jgi:hypothetical protein
MCAYDGWICSLEVHAWSAWFFPKLESVAIYRKTILNLKQENLDEVGRRRGKQYVCTHQTNQMTGKIGIQSA